MSTPFESIKARHQRLEGMVATQSAEIKTELSSQAHKDRGWLIEALDAATEQNEKLASELDRLSVAVEHIETKPRRRREREVEA